MHVILQWYAANLWNRFCKQFCQPGFLWNSWGHSWKYETLNWWLEYTPTKMIKINTSAKKEKQSSKPSNWSEPLVVHDHIYAWIGIRMFVPSPNDITMDMLSTIWNTIHAHGSVLTRQIFKVPSIRCTAMDVDRRSKNHIGTFTLRLARVAKTFWIIESLQSTKVRAMKFWIFADWFHLELGANGSCNQSNKIFIPCWS